MLGVESVCDVFTTATASLGNWAVVKNFHPHLGRAHVKPSFGPIHYIHCPSVGQFHSTNAWLKLRSAQHGGYKRYASTTTQLLNRDALYNPAAQPVEDFNPADGEHACA
jgi:hypothetical protein